LRRACFWGQGTYNEWTMTKNIHSLEAWWVQKLD
jgi:hypothetical protein